MIKATATSADGRKLVLLGLSHSNLDKLRADGLKGFIRVDGKEMGIDCDIMITADVDEHALAQALARYVGPDTKVHISDKLKS